MKEVELCEEFIDVGYMAENIEVLDFYMRKKLLKRSYKDKRMSLFISFTNLIDFLNEILELDAFLNDIKVDINCYIIFDKDLKEKASLKSRLEKLEIVFDEFEEFAYMYGTKIIEGNFKDKLTKSLFLIGKDGAIFYIDLPAKLSEKLSLDRLHLELNKAYTSYTGVGCHG